MDLILPPSLEYFCSLDWGRLNPGCFAWWACLPAEPTERYHVLAEWKFRDLDDEEIAAGYHAHTKALGLRRVRYVVGDPSMWIKDGRNRARGQSRGETFTRAKMPMRPGLNDRIAGWSRLARFLRVPLDRDGVPTGEPPILTIDEACPYLIRTIPAQRSSPADAEDVDTTGDDHGVDCLRYGAVSRPMPTVYDTTPPRPPRGSAGALLAEIRDGQGRAVIGAENVR